MAFTVRCYDDPVSTVQQYDATIRFIQEDQEPQASIFLVTEPLRGRSEDAAIKSKGSTIQLNVKRRIPIKHIPELVFEQQNMLLPRRMGNLTSTECSEMLLDTFHYIKGQLPYYARDIEGLHSDDEPLSSRKRDNDKELTTYQRTRLEYWLYGSHAARLLTGPITKSIPETCPDNCNIEKFCRQPPQLDVSEMSVPALEWKAGVREKHRDEKPWVTMHLVMLGFAYAVASQFLRAGEHAEVDEDTEFVLTPINFYERYTNTESCCLLISDARLLSWVQPMAEAIDLDQGNARQADDRSFLRRYRDTLYDMICGCDVKTPQTPSLGCCANGVTLVSLTVTRPQLQRANLYLHDIRTGRCLDFHVGDDRLIYGIPAASVIIRELRRSIQPARIYSISLEDQGNWVVPNVRWDPESNWEDQYQHTALRCRLDGIPRFSKSPYQMIAGVVNDPLLEKVSPCICTPNSCQTIKFPNDEFWSELDLGKFYAQGGTKKDMHEDFSPPQGCKWHIVARAGLRTEDQVAALDSFSCRVKEPMGKDGANIVRKILGACAWCAFKQARSTPDAVHSILRKRSPVSTHVVLIVLAC